MAKWQERAALLFKEEGLKNLNANRAGIYSNQEVTDFQDGVESIYEGYGYVG
jgi:hypothetical protein